ncbi:MAG: thioredoxin [Methanomassiliicoccales archaeon]|jgi:thioredoxin 1|nr:thioredoxin [Methanomassiliicoccales archaeon]
MDELEEIRRKKIKELMEAAERHTDSQWPSEPIVIDDVGFDGFVNRYEVAVVDCWAPWCGPCRMIAPVIDSLARELQGRVAFGKLNTDENQRIALQYRIQAIPTLLVFKNGKLVDRIVGAMPKDQIMKRIQKFM